MKEKSQFWLVALLLVGLIGAGNTGLVDPVENNELHPRRGCVVQS